MKQKLSVILLLLTTCVSTKQAAPPETVAARDNFFKSLQALCGKAYEGKIVADTPPSKGFEGRLVMHVRECSDNLIKIPFHVGKNRSRTWVLTKLPGGGLLLKHDHRKSDGSPDKSTMYGGDTVDAGEDNVQSFPADEYSKALFVKQGIPQSVGNTWKMMIDSKNFSYMLVREGREFRVDFDLSKTVKPPPPPWGSK